MMRFAACITIALVWTIPTPSAAQTGQPIRQSGNITPGHPAMWTTNGVISDGGTAAQGNLTTTGVTASGPGICQESAPPTSAGWQRICLDVTTAGGAAIEVQNFGSAAALPLTLNLNGTAYQFPFVLPGTGVIGPNTSFVGHVAIWNNTTGTLLADAGSVIVYKPVCDGNTDNAGSFQAAVNTAIASTGMLEISNPDGHLGCLFKSLTTAVPSDASHVSLAISIDQNVFVQYNASTGWLRFNGNSTVAGCANAPNYPTGTNCRFLGASVTGLTGVPGSQGTVQFTPYAGQNTGFTNTFIITFDHVNNFSLSNVSFNPSATYGISGNAIPDGVEVVGSFQGLIQNNNIYWTAIGIDLKAAAANNNDGTSFTRIIGNQFTNNQINAIQTSGSLPTTAGWVTQTYAAFNYFERNQYNNVSASCTDGSAGVKGCTNIYFDGNEGLGHIISNHEDDNYGSYAIYDGGIGDEIIGGVYNGDIHIQSAVLELDGQNISVNGGMFDDAGGSAIGATNGGINIGGTGRNVAIGGPLSVAGTFYNSICNDNSSGMNAQKNSWAYYDPTGDYVQHYGVLNSVNTLTAQILVVPSGGFIINGSSTGYTNFTSANASASIYTITFPAASGTIPLTSTVQTWSAVQHFANTALVLNGSTSGGMTLEAPAIAASYVITFPAATDTVAVLNTAQTWGAAQTFGVVVIPSGDFIINGSSSGYTNFASANSSASVYTITFPAASGTVALQSAVSQTCTVNQAKTLVFTNGILTSGTCNS